MNNISWNHIESTSLVNQKNGILIGRFMLCYKPCFLNLPTRSPLNHIKTCVLSFVFFTAGNNNALASNIHLELWITVIKTWRRRLTERGEVGEKAEPVRKLGRCQSTSPGFHPQVWIQAAWHPQPVQWTKCNIHMINICLSFVFFIRKCV